MLSFPKEVHLMAKTPVISGEGCRLSVLTLPLKIHGSEGVMANTDMGRGDGPRDTGSGRRMTQLLVMIGAGLALGIVLIAAMPALHGLLIMMFGEAPDAPRRVALVGAGLLLLVVTLAVGFRPHQPDTRRAGIIIVLGVPAATLVFIGLATPSDAAAMTFIRSVFLATTIVFPAALFFLFVATRRESLLNSYLANLERLGVLARRKLDQSGIVAFHVAADKAAGFEPEATRAHRVRSYLDRFAAAFGKLPANYVDEILKLTRAPIDQRTKPPEFPLGSTEFELKTILPVLITSVLATIGWITILPAFTSVPPSYGLESKEWFNPTNIAPASYAFLGAYFFSLQMLVRRFMRRDLGPNAYVAASSRIILSVIVAWLLVVVWDLLSGTPPTTATESPSTHDKWINAGAFVVGFFPFVLLQLIVNSLNTLTIPWDIPNIRRGIPLSELDGLTIWHESRLEEEDIENVANMADADIVDLMLTTKICPHRIIEWIDQAILYRFLLNPEDLGRNDPAKQTARELQKLGLRTATALVTTVKDAKTPIAWPTTLDPNALKLLADAIEIHPNFAPVMRWKGLGGKVLLEAA